MKTLKKSGLFILITTPMVLSMPARADIVGTDQMLTQKAHDIAINIF